MNGHASTSEGNLAEGLQDWTRQVWMIYKTLSTAPEALRDVQDGALSLVGALRLTHEFSLEHEISAVDSRTIRGHLANCGTVVFGLNESLQNLKSGTGEVQGVTKFARKLVVQAARISSFYEILRRPVQERILALLEEIQQIKSVDLQQSPVQNWSFVQGELSQRGIPEGVIEEEFFLISNWLKEEDPGNSSNSHLEVTSNGEQSSNSESVSVSSSSSAPRVSLSPAGAHDADDELPEYTPGKKPTTIAEKSRNLEETTAILNMESSATQLASSSSALPPAYTFEAGSDQEMDEEFKHYIQIAESHELKRRIIQRDQHPERGSYPHTWLPKNMQVQYSGRTETHTMLDGNSFTVMAYETAPQLLNEIESLLPVLRVSADGTGNDTVFNEGARTLKIMASTMHKFGVLQDHRVGSKMFSDMDALEYEATTASALDHQIMLPEQDFELAQKSYYMLLTYVMGMLGLMKDIFPGRTYVTRSREELADVWEHRKMPARTSWIEKQLAGWNQIEDTVLRCRDWHRLRPYLLDQAVRSLQQWRQAQELLISSDTLDQLTMTIISATGLPKSRMGAPSVWIKLVVYGSPTKLGPASRKLEVNTDTAKNTVSPVWDKVIPIELPRYPKMMDLEIYDKGITNKEISRIRLRFTNIPGVEKNFAGRSLMFEFDDDLILPFQINDGIGKGKEVEQPRLRIHMKWQGRYTLLEKSHLITSAPGKMFRRNVPGIPMPFEETDDSSPSSSVREEAGGRSGSIRSGAGAAGIIVTAGLSVLGNV